MSKQATKESWKIIQSGVIPIPTTVREVTFLRAVSAEFRNALLSGNKQVLVQVIFHAREVKDRPAAKKLTQ